MRTLENRKIESHPSNPFFGPKIQTKLTTGTVGDRYEIEADTVADSVVNKRKGAGVQQKPISETISKVQKQDLAKEEPLQKKEKDEKKEDKVQKKSDKEEDKKTVQKKCADCEGEEKKVQKKSEKEKKPVQAKLNKASPVNEGVESDLNSTKNNGHLMDENTKQEMESGFGTDFSNVNIHTDSKAVQMSNQLGAQAFTHGNDVYFNKGKYNPDSKEGKHLLAHELTHTIQQTGGKTKNSVQKQEMLQLAAIPWNISQWTTQVRESSNFSVSSGGTVAVTSNLQWIGPARCSDIASTIEVNIYRKRMVMDSNERHDIIALSGGSTSVGNLPEGTYYVEIILTGYNGDPTHCSLTGSLHIEAT